MNSRFIELFRCNFKDLVILEVELPNKELLLDPGEGVPLIDHFEDLLVGEGVLLDLEGFDLVGGLGGVAAGGVLGIPQGQGGGGGGHVG